MMWLMERFDIQNVYGMHNLPNMPVGQFGVRAGSIMAAADTLNITLQGKGGHAAMPHLCVDTMLVAANVISALQHIASRHVNPLDSVVVSITSVKGDNDSYNVIPQTVELKGTVRTLRPEVQDAVEARLKTTIEQTAAAFGAAAQIKLQTRLSGNH